MSILQHKYRYYSKWYKSMPVAERDTWIGDWVFQRLLMFGELIRQQHKEISQFKRNVTL